MSWSTQLRMPNFGPAIPLDPLTTQTPNMFNISVMVAAGLEGLIGVLSVCFAIASFIYVKTHSDEARKGLWWLSFAYLFLAIGWLAMYLATSVEHWRLYLPGPDIIPLHVGQFFLRLTNIVLLMMLVKIAYGLLYSWHQATPGHRVMLHCLHGVSVLLALVAAAACGGSTAYYWDMLVDPRLAVFHYLAIGCDGALFILMTATFIWCIRVLLVGKKKVKAYNRRIPDLLVASAAFAWASSLWGAAFAVNFNLFIKTLELLHFILPNAAFLYLDFVAMLLIFVAGVKKRGGLHSIGGGHHDDGSPPRKFKLGGGTSYQGVAQHGVEDHQEGYYSEDQPLRHAEQDVGMSQAVGYNQGHHKSAPIHHIVPARRSSEHARHSSYHDEPRHHNGGPVTAASPTPRNGFYDTPLDEPSHHEREREKKDPSVAHCELV
ncbi:uncharacterized protein B0I36DRAFT_435217 [Microdochium trichocladiopsis]|uniref:Uncharacterized protein n=1 Tax=Microdochium trichocladiopsis TaxID=1682393 RepID=A0A9P9BL69_9PEZI|nr:uncharacterized protein B0I36DRAFT_435217 [Microdochium trichocladiopsis]KAH7021387.1 hypothetical protein B0I36DRAFT_435217 [Microdochium trichocladiopsis]